MLDLYSVYTLQIAIIIIIASISVGIAQYRVNQTTFEAYNQQPTAHGGLARASLFGLATLEFSALVSLLIGLIMIRDTSIIAQEWYRVVGTLGMTLAIGLTASLVALYTASPVQAACLAIARQPLFSAEIFRFMLVVTSIMQSPVIFGFIIALFIRQQLLLTTDSYDIGRLIASGIAIGLGSLGPIIGLSQFARTACTQVGLHKHNYRNLFGFSLISQAIIETPILLAMVISIVLLFITPTSSTLPTLRVIQHITAAFCVSLGTLGSGISLGRITSATAKEIEPIGPWWGDLTRLSMLAQGFVETIAIYGAMAAFGLLLI